MIGRMFQLGLSVRFVIPTCTDIPLIYVPDQPKLCCPDPLEAVVSYLEGATPLEGPCVMFTATHRFDRFREWLKLIGGDVSDKVTFRRGHYADPISGKPMFTVGGLFLNPNEILRQGELLFVVPHQAAFAERTIRDHIPWLHKFKYHGSTRFWLSAGLAGLLKSFPRVVGPWQALLPQMDYQPCLWPEEDLRELEFTPTHSTIMSGINYIEEGCKDYSHIVRRLGVSCREILTGYAIIVSRSFGLELFPGEEASAIPFGPDLLNHNPNTISYISQVPWDMKRSETVFYLNRYTLGESRELYNNYGPHSLPSNMAMYGFTNPDTEDELVIIATTNGAFMGTVYPLISRYFCPSRIDFSSYPNPRNHMVCLANHIPITDGSFDPDGTFRLIDRDLYNFYPASSWKCASHQRGPLWERVEGDLINRLVYPEGDNYTLKLNVYDHTEPEMTNPVLAWFALCALPSNSGESKIREFVHLATTCAKPIGRQRDQFPVENSLKNMARMTLQNGCEGVNKRIGSLYQNVLRWIGFRSLRIRLTNKNYKIKNIGKELNEIFMNRPKNLIALLTLIIQDQTTVYTGHELIDFIVEYFGSDVGSIFKIEEIYKYKFQTNYLIEKKCGNAIQKKLKKTDYITM
jgi:hypothetical protein